MGRLTGKFFQYDREKTAQYLLDKTPRQLKAMCKSRQLPRKGTKKVLVEVLVNFIIDRKRPPGNIPKPKAGKRKRSGASSSQARKATTSNGKKNPDEEDSDAEDCAVDDSEDEELGEDDDTDVKEFPNPAVELFGAETASSGQEMSRATFRKQLRGLISEDQQVCHIIARANGGADHTHNYFIAGGVFNRKAGSKLDHVMAFLAGIHKTGLAVDASALYGSYDKRTQPSAQQLYDAGQRWFNQAQQ